MKIIHYISLIYFLSQCWGAGTCFTCSRLLALGSSSMILGAIYTSAGSGLATGLPAPASYNYFYRAASAPSKKRPGSPTLKFSLYNLIYEFAFKCLMSPINTKYTNKVKHFSFNEIFLV